MQKVNLNLIPGGVRPVINVSQYDEGRQFQLAIYNGSASYDLTGKTVIIEVGKRDGNGCAYGVSDLVNNIPVVAVTGNVVTITTPKQMTAVSGDNSAELKISDSSAEIGTLNFVLECEQSALSPETPISDTDIPALEDLASQNAQKALDAVAHYPYIDPTTKDWFVWDVDTGAFVDTGVRAQGIDGQGGVASVNSVLPDVDGNVALLLASSFSDILPTAHGGTGNSDGYIRTGLQSGVTAGQYSTSEGHFNYSHGYASHAEGESSVAVGRFSHAGGKGTNTDYDYQTAVGRYNLCRADSLFSVGYGTANDDRLSVFDVQNDGRVLKGNSDAFPAASNLATPELKKAASVSAPHTKSYDPGEYVFIIEDDKLYKVIGSSTVGTTTSFVVGTNIEEAPVGGELRQLNSDLAAVPTWHKVAESGTTSATYSAKLSGLLTAFQGLSAAAKQRSYLLIGGNQVAYPIQVTANSGYYGMLGIYYNNAFSFSMYQIASTGVLWAIDAAAGGNTITNYTTTTTTTNIELYAFY